MSHVWELEAAALGQIALAAVVLGAGLPVLFAAGIRALALGQGGDAEDPAAGGAPRPARPLGKVLAVVAFALVVAVVVLGVTVIVASGFGKELSFANVYPTLVDK